MNKSIVELLGGTAAAEALIDEVALIKGIAPAVEAVRAFLGELSKSPLVSPEGFTVTIDVRPRKPEV
jgi:hypothetical protein